MSELDLSRRNFFVGIAVAAVVPIEPVRSVTLAPITYITSKYDTFDVIYKVPTNWTLDSFDCDGSVMLVTISRGNETKIETVTIPGRA